jgi:hypothetical protein
MMLQRCHLKRSVIAAGILSLLPWLLVSSDPTGSAAKIASDEPGRSFAPHERVAEAVGLVETETKQPGPVSGRAPPDQPPRPEPLGLPGDTPQHGQRGPAPHAAQLPPSSDAALEVDVQAGDHGYFERVVFEWPERIAYDVAQPGAQVTLAFSHPGGIAFSGIRDRFSGRVLEARADGVDAASPVTLRVLADVTIRPFSLEDDRVVVGDVFGEPASRPFPPPPRPPWRYAASAAAEPEPAAAAGTRREGPSGAEASASQAPTGIDHGQGNGEAAPGVEVRAGDHGDFERVVFEWPESIAYDVAQRGEQVTVVFSRPGRIDLSAVRDRFSGRVLEAWADGGDAASQVTLRVLPDATIRSFSLENDRVVVVDVFGGSTSQDLRPAADLAQDSIGELRRELKQRDAVIDSLFARVEQLEQDAVLSGNDLDHIAAGRAPSAGERSLPQPSVAAAEQPPGGSASQQGAPTPGEGQGAGSTSAQAQPGQFEVDEDEIDRALERTLVQTGALLLPTGQAEVESRLSYARRETDAPTFFLENGTTFVGTSEVRRNEFELGQELRLGLPFDSQLELAFVHRYVHQSTVMKVGTGERAEDSANGHGPGDLTIGFAKTLLRENGGWWPDVVGRISWDTGTGEAADGPVILGGGFDELRGSLSATKQQDPLAFVGSVSYEKSFENDHVEPGDEIGLALGAVLAASPETSLRAVFGQTFSQEAKFYGESIDGSDRVLGTLTLGASSILGPGIMLDIAGDVGLTDNGVDYALRASLPIRFDLGVF